VSDVPAVEVFFTPAFYERLSRAAKSFSLTKRDFIRAIVAAALNEMEREQQTEREAGDGAA
jgi:predicted DNA-binding protein